MDLRVSSPAGLAGLVRSRPARLGTVRLVCVDGPAGSGKTTLAGSVAQQLGATVLHLDDLYEGWSGLDGVFHRLDAQVLQPLSHGLDGRYRRYDWVQARFAEWVDVPLPEVLVLEGCGSADLAVGDRASVIVWVEAPAGTRLARGLARDGEALAPEWHRWMVMEQEHFARHRTRERADVIVDGTVPPGTPVT